MNNKNINDYVDQKDIIRDWKTHLFVHGRHSPIYTLYGIQRYFTCECPYHKLYPMPLKYLK
jgi:hypothetical protein